MNYVKYLIITGAGASIPYGFPSGADLVSKFQNVGSTSNQIDKHFHTGNLAEFLKIWKSPASLVPFMEVIEISEAESD